MKPTQTLYEIKKLHHYYEGKPALQIEELSIQRGSIVGLVGPNGSGKSTFLRLLALVEKPTQGKIFFEGQIAEPFSNPARFQVTLLTQKPYLLKRSVYENLCYGLNLRGEKKNQRKRIYEALSWVGLSPEDFVNRPWYALSGGEAQRVALASRLVLKPKVLLLDEPTASVDVASAHRIQEASLRARQEWGTTLVIASHDWSWLHETCDTVLHLFKGHIISSGVGNVIFGPWIRSSSGFWEKRLQNGQKCIVSPPSSKEKDVAIIDPDAVTLIWDRPEADPENNVLACTLGRLSLEKSTGDILATLILDELSFTARLSQEQVRQTSLYPGRKVWISFSPHSVRWF
ncbi:energy-coupling factor ABC transporter ATP-binding protein [Desulfohalobiaceae bacterium Ax17]|jgi:tungstate transport system ATP-binding protein|uniref:energy-coupling factor ABC transporter ATP-binding protein n=1 Tax=Desulfovulcanus ferrireducens TaxID=2831190 RepID=UPI00336A0F3C|nr:energy-coupling factor ABC transporter ATP-binding protein [Desulfovulcanus ferrireducens]